MKFVYNIIKMKGQFMKFYYKLKMKYLKIALILKL